MDQKEKARLILKELEKKYGLDFYWSNDPFIVLISTVLSHRTRDEQTIIYAKKLFENYGNVEELAKANVDEVAELIRGVGFYRQKAKRIVKIAKIIKNEYMGKVPKSEEELLKLPGVGRKTANCVLAYAFSIPAIAVDTHVHRIANRIGIVKTNTPEETEKALKEIYDKEDWIKINNLLVDFGQKTCKPIKPKCDTCIIKNLCDYFIKNKA